VVEAKLNLQTLLENSKTIDDIINSPLAQEYLSASHPKGVEFRRRSPKHVKIDQIPDDNEMYQEINIIKGKAKNSDNFIVNKIFRKKKNAVKFILSRKVNEPKSHNNKSIIPKSKVFKKQIKVSLECQEGDHKQKLASRLAQL